jgi:hypothetical protein
MFSLSLVEDPARAVLQARVDHFPNLVTWATIVVAVGVVLEGVEIIHDVIAWSKRKSREKRERVDLEEVAKIFPTGEVRRETESHSDHARWVKRLLRLGLITVVIGVVGEWRYGAKLEAAHNAVHEYDIAKLADADKKAGEAATSARTAHDEADAVKTETDELTIRLGNAATQLGIIEQDIRAQGPRWRLLKKAAPELVKNLAPFTGQRVTLFVCGRLGSQDGETLSTWGAIAEMLNADGAKWKVEHGGLEYFDRGCSPSGGQPLGQGMMVFVNKHAPPATMEAAKALGEGLAKVLPPSPDKMPGLIDPDFSQKHMQPVEGKDTPWAMVANDPDLITMLIGAHPQQEAVTSKTKTNH